MSVTPFIVLKLKLTPIFGNVSREFVELISGSVKSALVKLIVVDELKAYTVSRKSGYDKLIDRLGSLIPKAELLAKMKVHSNHLSYTVPHPPLVVKGSEAPLTTSRRVRSTFNRSSKERRERNERLSRRPVLLQTVLRSRASRRDRKRQ